MVAVGSDDEGTTTEGSFFLSSFTSTIARMKTEIKPTVMMMAMTIAVMSVPLSESVFVLLESKLDSLNTVNSTVVAGAAAREASTQTVLTPPPVHPGAHLHVN